MGAQICVIITFHVLDEGALQRTLSQTWTKLSASLSVICKLVSVMLAGESMTGLKKLCVTEVVLCSLAPGLEPVTSQPMGGRRTNK